MAKIIKAREYVTVVSYSMVYTRNDDSGFGFSFDCDEKGNVFTDGMQPAGLENYQACVDGTIDVTCEGLRRNQHGYTEPAILKCDCGHRVRLHSNTNTCGNCEADYNIIGQLLAPREQWGEETGEAWYECL